MVNLFPKYLSICFFPGNQPHEFKLAIWWYKADAVLSLKLAEFYTLMKLAVVNGDSGLTRAVIEEQ